MLPKIHSIGLATLSLLVSPLVSTAQDSSAAPDEPPAAKARLTEEILVTGSRVRRKDLSSPAPVTVISREEIAASGKVSIGEFLQSLPDQGNARNAQFNNGGDGSVRVGLRGLGDYRTLVLLNGRRFVPGGVGADMSVDLGSLPSAAVERIEILKDGAAPIFGSDAVGGVVNVITRRRWSGTEAGAYSGISSRRDGATHDVHFTTGLSADAGSLLFSAAYATQKPIWAGDRPFSTYIQSYDFTGIASPAGAVGPYRVGSDNTPYGSIVLRPRERGVPLDNPSGDPRIARYNALVTANPTAGRFVYDPTIDDWRPYVGGALPVDGGDQYNYQPANYLLTPSRRLSLFATGERQLGSSARAFFEASYVNRESEVKIATEPLSTKSDGIVVSADNRWNPFGRDFERVLRRLTEFSNRSYAQNVGTVRVVTGLEGALPELGQLGRGWTWEVALNHGRTEAVELKRGYTINSRLRSALGPSYQDAGGGWHCGQAALPSGAEPFPGCVPLDLFGGPGSITADQLAYLTFDGAARGTNQLTSAQAGLSGEIFRLWSERPAGLALGYEYRKTWGSLIPDPMTSSGDASTDGAVKTTRGSLDVHEAYAELSLPVVDQRFLAETVELTGAARVFRYGGFGTDWTWKVGARWAPLPDLTVRGTLSTAFRAPAVAELYYGQSVSRSRVPDSCAGENAAGNPVAVSPHCGPAAGNGQPLPEVTILGGGNPALKPEVARIATLGAIALPRYVPRLSLTLDWYAIEIRRTIRALGAVLVDACYPMSSDRAPLYCQYLERDPATQQLIRLTDIPQNAGTERMSGLDLAARYALPTPAGRFGLALDATWLQRYQVIQGDGSVLRVRGTNGEWVVAGTGGSYFPAWKARAGLTWALGALGAGATLRYLGSVKECFDAYGDTAYCSFEHAYEHRLPAVAYVDAFVGYRLASTAGQTELVAGLQNAFDRQPPVAYTLFYPSDPAAYDFVGRFFYVRLSHRL